MCGVFAAIAPKGAPPCRFAPRAVDILKHRGPDAQGTLHVDLPWASVTLGMSRLKVVDQRDLAVPFDFRENFGIVLAFNGEIYNWRELRHILSPAPWTTDCDAEVLAAAWRKHGPGCLDELNGMFAFVLVDTIHHEVYAVRDRAGEKPLYWAQRGDAFYFASEPKALPVALCECPCDDMDVLEFDCGQSTPLEDVYAVCPGELWTREGAGFGSRQWWQLQPGAPAAPLDERVYWERLVELEETFVSAVRLRHVAERKVAIQLSGGLDSAMTQAVSHCRHPYCVTFPELDNLTAARVAASPLDQQGIGPSPPVEPVTFTRDELLAALPEVAYYLDTPATWTAVCQWFLNKRIAEDGGVVVLSGEGADELFGGYSRYRILYWLDRMLADPHLQAYMPLITRVLGGRTQVLAHMLNRGQAPSLEHAAWLVETHGAGQGLADIMMQADFYTTMQVLVRMADRMSACFGLENRSPFFDYRLMELSSLLPTSVKVTKRESKSILRHAASRLGVDSRITQEGTKRGLTLPSSWGEAGKPWDRAWFKDEMLKAWRRACLRPALCDTCSR